MTIGRAPHSSDIRIDGVQWWILHAIYAVTDASANACARSEPNTGSGADPDTGIRTLSFLLCGSA